MTDLPTGRKVRPVFVYRVVVLSYPEGSLEPGWRPACWRNPDPALMPSRLKRALLHLELARKAFRWPVPNQCLSASTAQRRAGLLSWYGAEVRVDRSNPVTWPQDGDQS
jgi:hypothetical protein